MMRGGSEMMMQGGQMHVEHLGDGSTRTFEMEALEEGFGGMMMFFEPGEHELHLQGTGQMGGMVHELGQHVLTVHRQHRVLGPHWVELAVDSAPVLANRTAHIAFLVFELADAVAGEPVAGLTTRVTIHDPTGRGPTATLIESPPGRYGADHTFGEPGLYELHLEIDVDGDVVTGAFHLPVLASSDDSGLDYQDHHGKRGHGTGS